MSDNPNIPELLNLYATARQQRRMRGKEEESIEEHHVKRALDVRIELNIVEALKAVDDSGLLAHSLFFLGFRCARADKVQILLGNEVNRTDEAYMKRDRLRELMLPHIPWQNEVEITIGFDNDP